MEPATQHAPAALACQWRAVPADKKHAGELLQRCYNGHISHKSQVVSVMVAHKSRVENLGNLWKQDLPNTPSACKRRGQT
eukprot:33391-Pelagomonas_calceolata.AAC.2